jgi:hypothetical protein
MAKNNVSETIPPARTVKSIWRTERVTRWLGRKKDVNDEEAGKKAE